MSIIIIIIIIIIIYCKTLCVYIVAHCCIYFRAPCGAMAMKIFELLFCSRVYSHNLFYIYNYIPVKQYVHNNGMYA